MESGLTVADLVMAAERGDPSAWDALVERYTPLILSVARRYGLDSEDIADACQVTWMRAFENLGSLREPAALPYWLLTITRRECLRIMRQRRLSVSYDPLPEDSASRTSG